ncbi:podoplanin isoform 2-T2 [Spinachia spinachia]
MNVQLLLALALVGPFCAFTHASPTEIPKVLDVESGGAVAEPAADVTQAPAVDSTVITGPPATEPQAVPEEVATTEAAAATEAAPATEVATEAALSTITLTTEEVVVETEVQAAATSSPEPLFTDPAVVDTADPSDTTADEVQPTGHFKVTDKPVVVEAESDAAMSSGQVVGIVIGALFVVVIAIAVVIAVVRRMGKYS